MWARFIYSLCGFELRKNGDPICKWEAFGEVKDDPEAMESLLQGMHPIIKRVKKDNPMMEGIWKENRKRGYSIEKKIDIYK
jgi:hypothetical protein